MISLIIALFLYYFSIAFFIGASALGVILLDERKKFGSKLDFYMDRLTENTQIRYTRKILWSLVILIVSSIFLYYLRGSSKFVGPVNYFLGIEKLLQLGSLAIILYIILILNPKIQRVLVQIKKGRETTKEVANALWNLRNWRNEFLLILLIFGITLLFMSSVVASLI